MTKDEDRATWLRSFGLFGVILADVVGFTGAGAAIGFVGMKHWGWTVWGAAVTTGAGFIVAMVRLYEVSKKEWK